MPAESKSQQKLMGMALASKRGKGHFSKKIRDIAKSMNEKQLRDFAKTKTTGLPDKKGHMNTDQAFIDGFVKRAATHGLDYNSAIFLLKQAAPPVPKPQAAPTIPKPQAAKPPISKPQATKPQATKPPVEQITGPRMAPGAKSYIDIIRETGMPEY